MIFIVMVTNKFTDDEILKIKGCYIQGLSCVEIGKIYGISKTPINKLLKELGVLRKSKSNGKKIILSEEQKNKIKEMYCDGLKSANEISVELNLTKSFIDKYLSTVNFRRTKSEAMRVIKTGKKLSDKVKQNMKIGQQKFAKSGNRQQTGGVCKRFVVNGLTCNGTYEKYYIEKLIDMGEVLPNEGGSVITPYGVYYPDFKINDTFIEIKSDYTFDVLIGKIKSRFNGDFETKQLHKIKWVNENIGNVDIIVVDKKNNKLIKKEI